MDITAIEEKVSRGANYTLSLPSLPDKNANESSYFTRFYDRLRKLCIRFAEADPIRVRSYKCSYTVLAEGDRVLISVTITARIKERGESPVTAKRRLVDKWSDGVLVSHSCLSVQ